MTADADLCYMECNDCHRHWIGYVDDWCPGCKSSNAEPENEPEASRR